MFRLRHTRCILTSTRTSPTTPRSKKSSPRSLLQFGSGRVDWSCGLDENDDRFGALNREDEIFGDVLTGEACFGDVEVWSMTARSVWNRAKLRWVRNGNERERERLVKLWLKSYTASVYPTFSTRFHILL